MKPSTSNPPPIDTDDDLVAVITGSGPCTYLLLALIAFILLFPYAEESVSGRVALGGLMSLIVVGAAWAIRRSQRMLTLGVTLGLTAVTLQWTSLLTSSRVGFMAAGLVYAVLLATMIVEILRYLLKRGPVTADKLHGALAGYLMMALLWAFLYAVLDQIDPQSFHGAQLDLEQPGTFFRLIYFSFTVLTTVGFGDVTAATDKARSLVIVEEVAGVFFVSVLIARLAGLYPPQTRP